MTNAEDDSSRRFQWSHRQKNAQWTLKIWLEKENLNGLQLFAFSEEKRPSNYEH